jgi:hypothetical protein
MFIWKKMNNLQVITLKKRTEVLRPKQVYTLC